MSTDLVELGRRIARETGHYAGGPPHDFEIVGRHTFQTLLAGGLMPSHRLLDFGCGSLRNGNWLMRCLDTGNYYGIEPVEKGVRAGLKHLIGPELEAFKKTLAGFLEYCERALAETNQTSRRTDPECPVIETLRSKRS